MAERHERIAALIRQYGRDPDGVARALLEAGEDPQAAAKNRLTYADALEHWGYDVEPTADDLPITDSARMDEPDEVDDLPFGDEPVGLDWPYEAGEFDPDNYDTKGEACEAYVELRPSATPTEVAEAVGCSVGYARRYTQESDT